MSGPVTDLTVNMTNPDPDYVQEFSNGVPTDEYYFKEMRIVYNLTHSPSVVGKLHLGSDGILYSIFGGLTTQKNKVFHSAQTAFNNWVMDKLILDTPNRSDCLLEEST